MWQIESHTSLGWRCTSACMAKHWIICLSCVHRLLKLLNDSIFVPPATIYSLFHSFSSIRTAVAPSLSLDQRHGTCSKTICVRQTCKLPVFVVHWRRFFLISTRHIERIRGAFCDDALYKLTFTFARSVRIHLENGSQNGVYVCVLTCLMEIFWLTAVSRRAVKTECWYCTVLWMSTALWSLPTWRHLAPGKFTFYCFLESHSKPPQAVHGIDSTAWCFHCVSLSRCLSRSNIDSSTV